MADIKDKMMGLIWHKQDCGLTHNAKGQDSVTYNAELADHLIANGVTVQEWIPVTERLPEKDVKVLTFGVYGFSVNYRDRFSGKWRGVNGRSQWITHWMPLPEPPKGEQRND